ncbi:MAG TPA: ATP-dependent DNA helicase, partial [Thermoanaerobaculia bacterium]|nr:ATP-dependent DNA helicase [Thermoanaerobaculia bacterium]
EILNAKPYAFLDDTPLEERRTQAVYTRRAGDMATADDLGRLDAAAIERVRDEERPDPRDADELHDALLTFGFLTHDEASAIDDSLFTQLVKARRAGVVADLWVAAERVPELLAVHADATASIAAPPSRAAKTWTREEALVELMRGRMQLVGPTTARSLADSLHVAERDADAALLALETEGAVLRGAFERRGDVVEWCDRRLLARIHRYTLTRLRAEIEPVGAADFQRFLFAWQHATSSTKLAGVDGLQQIVAQLDGFEIAAAAWEKHVLPLRVASYEPSLLDSLSLTGDVGWARLSAATGAMPVGATPIALFLADHAGAWQSLRDEQELVLTEGARRVLEALRTRGASFAREINEPDLERALAELVAAGLITSDGFAGLRSLVGTAPNARLAGRWSPLPAGVGRDEAVEAQARTLLRRYGVVFRRLLTREPNAAPWRELARIYRRLEARGEIRGGRFVAGMSGEQFALGEAVDRLRELRREGADGSVIVISAADPLNLTGILTTAERVRAVATNRIAFRDGVAISVMEGDYLRALADVDEALAMDIAAALAGRAVPVSSGYVGRL